MGEEELNIKTDKLDANNFRKAETSSNLMNDNTTKVSTKGETEEGCVRVPKDDKYSGRGAGGGEDGKDIKDGVEDSDDDSGDGGDGEDGGDGKSGRGSGAEQ